MSEKDFGKNSIKALRIHQKLESSILNSIRKVLPDTIITRICDECQYHFRNRKITPIAVVLHYIISAIWPEESFNACWQVLWAGACGNHPEISGKCPARGSVSVARNRMPKEVMFKVFNWISQQSQKLADSFSRWHSHRVVLVDGTCLSMSDEPELHKEFGAPTVCQGKTKYPVARLVGLCLSNTMTVIAYNIGKYRSDENELLKPLLKKLQKGDLLLADRHYAGANLYWRYAQNGLEYLTRVHQKLKLSRIKPVCVYSRNDFIGYIETGRENRRVPGKPEGTRYLFA